VKKWPGFYYYRYREINLSRYVYADQITKLRSAGKAFSSKSLLISIPVVISWGEFHGITSSSNQLLFTPVDFLPMACGDPRCRPYFLDFSMNGRHKILEIN